MLQHKLTKGSLFAATCLMAATAAHAFDGFYVSSNLVAPNPDEARQADADYGLNGIIGSSLNENWNVELGLHGNKFILDSGQTEYKQNSVNLDLLWHPVHGNRYYPYILVGGGWLQTEYADKTFNNPLSSLGFGTFYDFRDQNGWLLRGGVNFRHDMDDESDPKDQDYIDTILYFGLTYVFDDSGWLGASNKDSGEGASPANDLATEGLGVECEDGQPCVDESHSLEAGMVAADSLPENSVFAVQFELNSSVLDTPAQTELEKVAALLVADEGLKAVITGHADLQDGDSNNYNQWLSDKRAFKVHNYLADLGVYAGRMEFRGYGDKVPKVVNLTEDHRTKNRRVEIHLYR